MKPIVLHFTGALALTFTIAACVPAPGSTPAPTTGTAPTPRPVPAPAPAPTQAAIYSSWMDVPATPGNWSFSAGDSMARFGESASEPRLAFGCTRSPRQVMLIRHGTAANLPATLTIRTETATRTLTATPASDRASVSVALAANDPLLDAMALTKGRFAVEAQGLPTLYVPAWGEVTRVIEDCR